MKNKQINRQERKMLSNDVKNTPRTTTPATKMSTEKNSASSSMGSDYMEDTTTAPTTIQSRGWHGHPLEDIKISAQSPSSSNGSSNSTAKFNQSSNKRSGWIEISREHNGRRQR